MSKMKGGHRYGFDYHNSDVTEANSHQLDEQSFSEACDMLRKDTFGFEEEIQTPFGEKM